MSKVDLHRRSAIGAIMAAPLAAKAQVRGGGRRPNFLFVLPDQYRFDWLGGDPALPVRTPNLDAIATRGVRFDKAYSAAPVCSPSRACLAAGREYDACGVGSNAMNYPVAQTTYYTELRKAGYHVAACGKLDLSKPSYDEGLDGRNHTAEWGFSDMVNCGGKGDGVRDYYKHKAPTEPYMFYLAKRGTADLYANEIAALGMGGATLKDYNNTAPSKQTDEDYEDNWIGRVGLDMLKGFKKGQPWHLVVNFAGPHDPGNITERMAATVKDRTFPPPIANDQLPPDRHSAIRQNYTAMCENIDRWIGIYVDELKKRGELDNTIIVFSSDHGEMLGDHNRWAKNVPYESSLCVPMVIGGPGVKHRRKCDAMVSLIDVAATFLDYARAERPEGMTAISMRPLLEGKTDKHRDILNSGLSTWRLVSDGRYKLIRGFDLKSERGAMGPTGPDRPMVLFDLKTDPQELKNVYDSEPAVVARLAPLLPPINMHPNWGGPRDPNAPRPTPAAG